MRPSRRQFVKWVSASGIALTMSRLAAAEDTTFAASQTLPGRNKWNPAAKGAGRVDGAAKVTGAKLYASDFRAADLPGWPAKTAHAILIRAPDATHVYTGLDLARLTGALQPSVVVTAADLVRAGTRVPEFYTGDLFCPVGRTPIYLGQPVALLMFEEFDAYDAARLKIRDAGFVKFAEETGARRAGRLRRQPLYPRRRSDARGARCLFAGPRRLGQSRQVAKCRAPHLDAARDRGRGGLRQGGDPWRADPRRTGRNQSGAADARPRVRNAIRRPGVPRAGKRARLVRCGRQKPRARARRAVALRRR